MPTTWQNLVDETRLHLYSGERDPLFVLATTGTDAEGDYITTTEPYGNSVRPGTVLAIGAEVMLVTKISVADKRANVVRGYLGSTEYTHTPGDLVWVNPKFSEFAIFKELLSELDALSSPQNGLFQIIALPVTRTSTGVYDFAPTDFMSVWRVRVPLSTPYPNRRLRYDLVGGVLRVNEHYVHDSVTVYYRAGFTRPAAPPTGLAEDVADSGLHPEAFDILPMGAAARLNAPREVKRGFTEAQTDARRADEVPPGTSIGATRALLALRAQRISEESARLVARYGYDGA